MMKHMVRYQLVLLIFLVSMVVNLDRTNIAIAGTYLADDYNITKIQLGWVFSAFMIGYAVFQIPAGWIVNKLGPRLTTTVRPDLVERAERHHRLGAAGHGARAFGADRGALHPGRWRGGGLSIGQPVRRRLVSQP